MIRVEAVKTKNKNPCLGREVSSLGETERGAWQQKYQNQYSVKIIKKRRSLTMKKFVKSMMLAVVSLMSIAFFSACEKEMMNEPLQVEETKAVMNDRENLSLFAASKPIDQYSEEEIVKEVFPMLQKFIDAQFAYAIGKDKIPQWNQYLLTPDDELQNRIDQAVCLDGESSKILSYSGYLKKSDTGYTKIYFMDNRWYFDGVVEKFQLQLSNGIESEGGWNYSFIVSQDTNHNWKIESWKDDENITQHSIWYRDESGYLQGHIKECIRAFGVRAGYSGQAAANYAREHWNDPNPNWCDYTYNGGDCTNFVSQCLQETKAVMNNEENLSLLTVAKPVDQYSEEEIVKEVFPILQKFIDAQFAYAMGKDKIPQWDQYLIVPDQKLKEDMDLAINKKLIPTILSATGTLKKSDLGYTKVFFSEGKWVISKAVEYFKIHLKRDNSEPIVSEGGWNYSFEVVKDKSGTWKINSWRDDENLMRYPFWNPKPSTTLFSQKKKGLIQPMTVGLERRAYNRVAAANYAINHWNSPNSLWCDYTTTGGDCTNFVSQCLLAGGWTQKTGSGYCQDDAWFHKGIGHCWNTSTVRNYSCSWTQAKDLYRYLSYVSNASLVWMGNQTPYARIGDIIQIKGSNSEMVHSTIVTKIAGGHIYVTYRNAYNYDPAKDVAIDLFGYENCYYWSINGRNGMFA